MDNQAIFPVLAEMLPAPEASVNRDDPRQRFADFYRAHLRFRVGQRVGATKLLDAYRAWASDHRQADLSFKQLRHLMTTVGHKRRLSDGVQYLDVAYAASWDDDADVLPVLKLVEPVARGRRRRGHVVTDFDRTIAQIDAALAQLLDARRTIEAIRATDQPHLAASRILNRPAE